MKKMILIGATVLALGSLLHAQPEAEKLFNAVAAGDFEELNSLVKKGEVLR